MVDWNDNQVKLVVYLINGTSFLAMFFIMAFWYKRISHIEMMNHFKYLAIFGLLHGLGEYSEIPRFLAWQPYWIFDLIRLLLISGSFAALLSFGVNVLSSGIEEYRWIRGIPLGAIWMYYWLLIFIGIDFTNSNNGLNYETVDLAQRYTMGFLGAMISSYAFFDLSKKLCAIVGEEAGKRFIHAGIGLGLYMIFGGLIVNPVLGIPIVVYNSIIAIIITIAIIRIFQLFEIKQDHF
ncbi:MAG: hypothetical protein J5U19_13025 [Candidatus Methanoperedens sp.]|nr:hypothetical protein [Candidatus Methanoperedens sp.]MCE8429299.1 hypothetical protein [Candidatus Methanoperedens sp.]